MFYVRRNKGGAIHYAAQLTDRGHITALTKSRMEARQVDRDTGEKVIEHYESLAEDKPSDAVKFGQLDLVAVDS